MTTSSEQVAAIHAKIDRGEPITKDDRAVLLADQCSSAQQRIRQAMTSARAKHENPVTYSQGNHNAVGQAIDMVILEMFVISAAHSKKREEVQAQMKEYVAQEVRLLLKFCENQARKIDDLNRQVSAIEKSLGLANSKTTARRA